MLAPGRPPAEPPVGNSSARQQQTTAEPPAGRRTVDNDGDSNTLWQQQRTTTTTNDSNDDSGGRSQQRPQQPINNNNSGNRKGPNHHTHNRHPHLEQCGPDSHDYRAWGTLGVHRAPQRRQIGHRVRDLRMRWVEADLRVPWGHADLHPGPLSHPMSGKSNATQHNNTVPSCIAVTRSVKR